MKMFNPSKPSDLIKRVYLDPIQDVLDGKPIDKITAVKLSEILGRTPESWLEMQKQYDERGKV